MLSLLVVHSDGHGGWHMPHTQPIDFKGVVHERSYFFIDEYLVTEHFDILYRHSHNDVYERQVISRLELPEPDWFEVGSDHTKTEINGIPDVAVDYRMTRRMEDKGWFADFDSWVEAMDYCGNYDAGVYPSSFVDDAGLSIYLLVI